MSGNLRRFRPFGGVWFFSLGVVASLVLATGAEASGGAAVTPPPGRWWSRAENPRSRWLRGRQADRSEPKRGTT